MESGNPNQTFGIHELYRPTDGIADVDIVAVHGLNGDARGTWTSKSTQTSWLSHPDFLPKYLPRARILSWGYNANISTLKGKSTSQDRILHHAHTLVSQLNADRELEDAAERPIIFLCHSLGGIVVKKALAYSASRTGQKISFLHSLYTCTYGILFFGTPHHGSSKANLGSVIQKMASVTIPRSVLNTESNLIKALREGSETLQDINDQFCPLISRFRIIFFWEQERTEVKILKLIDYIVTEASAAPILDNTERCGIAANHSEMCKFESTRCQGFRDVVAALKRLCRSAPEVIMTRVLREREVLLQRRRDEAAEIMGTCLPNFGLAAEHSNDTLSPDAPRSILACTKAGNSLVGRRLLDTGGQSSLSQLAPKEQ
ncbi:uncharacterized protein A1O5_12046 [Cladophialophora psammophila CBS 110553]|uniref:DUF676 domain-containing protein n=1 Tax=Cladophialophora psammophila CBS 110553 TaxID=1182543 RepID=W9WSC2_9EURO|nr:uncharacterized protein A1O5_12046 [Cladophialophora psammophila CBS 110553]EXJ61254.1 hypothetical protein A1O5_12046 [Cladophialophora psammophila CBS 110553]